MKHMYSKPTVKRLTIPKPFKTVLVLRRGCPHFDILRTWEHVCLPGRLTGTEKNILVAAAAVRSSGSRISATDLMVG